MTSSTTWDEHTPGRLSPGTHLSPEDGTCLMEAVSVAAHQPWSDAPVCTHPLVAHLARLVNDAMSGAGRQRLTDLVPDLMAAGPGDPATAALVSARVAAVCTQRALRYRSTALLMHLHHVAADQLERERCLHGPDPVPSVRLRRWLFARGPAARGVEAAVAACLRLPGPDRDTALLGLLRAGLAAVVGPAPARPVGRRATVCRNGPPVGGA